MNKKDRTLVFNKYNGRCAYSGCPLPSNWQVDHIRPLYYYQKFRTMRYDQICYDETILHTDNMVPAIKIINHYKRGKNLEEFRLYLMTLHERLQRYPKNPTVARSVKRKAYIMEVAGYFGITADQPFSGKFYFETLP